VVLAFAAGARRSGGQLIATGRIPIQAIIASIDAGRQAKTAVVAAAITPGGAAGE
jgi:hypothetical protein